jgi:mono/diheme cytochrome c family protein
MYALLEANQCLACHTVGDRGNSLSGPSLNGLAARIDTYGLAQSAEAYIYESLANPAAYLPASCPTGQCANIMPSYADRLSNDELNSLVTFLLSLPSESP